jgi:hypothetical protein
MVFIRSKILENAHDDDEAAEQAVQNLTTFRIALIEDMIFDDELDVTELHRALLTTAIEMTRAEFNLLWNLVRVYDHARPFRFHNL